jgi:hypothetical protein
MPIIDDILRKYLREEYLILEQIGQKTAEGIKKEQKDCS